MCPIGTIVECMDKYFSKKGSNPKKKDLPWISSRIQFEMKDRDRLIKRNRKTPNDSELGQRCKEKVKCVRELMMRVKYEHPKEHHLGSKQGWIRITESSLDKKNFSAGNEIDREYNEDNYAITVKINEYYVKCVPSPADFPIVEAVLSDTLSDTEKLKFTLLNSLEFFDQLKHLNYRKTTGSDGVQLFLKKRLTSVIFVPLTNILICNLITGRFPSAPKGPSWSRWHKCETKTIRWFRAHIFAVSVFEDILKNYSTSRFTCAWKREKWFRFFSPDTGKNYRRVPFYWKLWKVGKVP